MRHETIHATSQHLPKGEVQASRIILQQHPSYLHTLSTRLPHIRMTALLTRDHTSLVPCRLRRPARRIGGCYQLPTLPQQQQQPVPWHEEMSSTRLDIDTSKNQCNMCGTCCQVSEVRAFSFICSQMTIEQHLHSNVIACQAAKPAPRSTPRSSFSHSSGTSA